jgi:hypothetical protein
VGLVFVLFEDALLSPPVALPMPRSSETLFADASLAVVGAEAAAVEIPTPSSFMKSAQSEEEASDGFSSSSAPRDDLKPRPRALIISSTASGGKCETLELSCADRRWMSFCVPNPGATMGSCSSTRAERRVVRFSLEAPAAALGRVGVVEYATGPPSSFMNDKTHQDLRLNRKILAANGGLVADRISESFGGLPKWGRWWSSWWSSRWSWWLGLQ